MSPSRSYKLSKVLCAKLLVLALLPFSAVPVFGATLTVTNTNDIGSGSLRDTIVASAPDDTIDFSVTGVITLTSGELVIDKNLTISGPGASSLAISGNLASRVFHITGAATVSISGVTIRDGRVSSVYSFPDNSGGGIFIESGASLTLAHSTISGNSATYWGGGIANQGTLTLTSSILSGNSASDWGGGILNYGGRWEVRNAEDGTATLTNSTLSGNSAYSGGGIYNYYLSRLTLANSTVSDNSAATYGGGISNYIGTLTLTNSTVSGNSAVYYGGGIWNTDNGRATLTNSTVAGNSVAYFGGGIYNWSGGTVTVTNSTLSGNSANSGGGIGNRGTLTLKNTIVANTSGGNCYNVSETFASQGHNLSSDGTCARFFTQTSDMNSTDPLLDPAGVKNNGGPTQTIALLEGSPAIDAIPVVLVNYCTETDGTTPIATDQRGVVRPVGPACDIGAFEGSLDLNLNQSPVANAGPDQIGFVNVALTFDGSASHDPDGILVSYQWDFGDYTTASGVTVSHTYATAGSYTATLTVTDDGGAAASVTAQLTIQTPAQATGTLKSEVLALELSRGIEQSLSATLNAALASIDQGDQLAKLAAINQLQSFVYQVSALQGVKLTPEEAASLIATAQKIMQSLSSSL